MAPMKTFLFLLPLALLGCSYTYPIGTVGSKRFVKVQAASLSGPTQTMIVIVDTNSNEVTMLTPMGGNGILTAATISGSIVGGSYFVGRGLGRGGDRTTVNAVAESSSESAATATPLITVPDPPPAPPIIRTRPPFGKAWGHHK